MTFSGHTQGLLRERRKQQEEQRKAQVFALQEDIITLQGILNRISLRSGTARLKLAELIGQLRAKANEIANSPLPPD